MPLLDTQGNDSADAYGGGAAAVPNYIENVFSTYLYTGNGSTSQRAITTGIDTSTYGGLTWFKNRTSSGPYHNLLDTNRGAGNVLYSNTTDAQGTDSGFNSFTTTGVLLNGNTNSYNQNASNYVLWTFRKQPKFFDVITWTGNGGFQPINHNLGSIPGCVIYKATSTTSDWFTVNRYSNNTYGGLKLNSAAGAAFSGNSAAASGLTSTTFDPAYTWGNTNGVTYVAYLFAHNAGGFGLTGTDNVISCGTFTTDGSQNATVNLGYEPQFVIFKSTSYADNWITIDTMRGWNYSQGINYLEPNATVAEANYSAANYPTATGFQINTGNPSSTYIYIAIRKGPMAVPIDGTSVFSPNNFTPPTSTNTITTNFPVDLAMFMDRSGNAGFGDIFVDRLRGATSTSAAYLVSTSAGSETLASGRGMNFASNTGYTEDLSYNYFGEQTSTIFWNMRRAPSFFDEVCWTGTGSNLTVNHNLQVTPELIILKYRAGTSYGWKVTATGLTNPNTYYLGLNNSNAETNYGANLIYNRTTTTFDVSSDLAQSGWNWVSYLFATCAGVSKVGTYTGNGTTQAIACGFTGGARFVLIKRTDAAGGWYVYDTARGMTTLTDPYLLLNSTAAESATLGSVTTTTGGFTVNAAILAAINTSSATYIFLAIA